MLSLACLALFTTSCTPRKTAYVDIFKLVSEFELQKEYSEQAKKNIGREKEVVDSLIFSEKLRDPAAGENLRSQLYSNLYRKSEEANKEIEDLIWKRLNPYLADYGKEKGYEYIYGANGTGNVLYADKGQDITEDVIKYVNGRYHDKK
mgnify:CR=1 FL=1